MENFHPIGSSIITKPGVGYLFFFYGGEEFLNKNKKIKHENETLNGFRCENPMAHMR